MDVSRAIRKVMAAKQIRPAELARRMGTTTAYISKITRPRYVRDPRLRTIARIARALEVEPEELVRIAREYPTDEA